jgi:transglutaminase-like putative cysteine protease
VEDGTLRVKIDKGDGSPRLERAVRWNADVVGLAQMEQVFRQRKVKPGDRFTLLRYEPTLNSVLTVRVAVREPEAVDLLGVRQSLVRVELTPDKLVTPSQTVQPAKMVWWLDGEHTPVRRQMDLEGLGLVVLTRTTKEIAQAPASGAVRVPDLGLKALIPLDRAISRPYTTRRAVYRVTIQDDPDPGTILVQDGHQHVAERKGNTLELHVHPVPAAARLDEVRPGRPAAEFLESCRYIDSADERIQALARRAVGEEKDAWRKAVRIEKYVKGFVRVDQTAPLVPASQIAAQPRGDCRHSAFLTTALCRAEGIPARTAIGLIYVFKGRPQMGFHMWTEVWIDGRWVGLDATLGRGGVSAAHIKVTDHSWYATESLTPFLPVQRVLGKISLDVLRVEGGE